MTVVSKKVSVSLGTGKKHTQALRSRLLRTV